MILKLKATNARKHWEKHIWNLLSLAEQAAEVNRYCKHDLNTITAEVLADVEAEEAFLNDFWSQVVPVNLNGKYNYLTTATHQTSKFEALKLFRCQLNGQRLELQHVEVIKVRRQDSSWRVSNDGSGFDVWTVLVEEKTPKLE